jgi:hypothetical protein
MEEWEREIVFGKADWDSAILLLTSDVTNPTVFHFPRRFS